MSDISLYFRSIHNDKKQRHFYLKGRKGLYPSYPSKKATRLILTESIIDAASLIEQAAIKSKYEILALYGTNGLTKEHIGAMSQIEDLQEIIFFLNGDSPGKTAVEKYAPMLRAYHPKAKITMVEVPENEDVNSLLQSHSPEILTHLIESRKEYTFLFSSENQLKEKELVEEVRIPPTTQVETEPTITKGLNTANPYNIKYTTDEVEYRIKGFKTDQMDSLKASIQIVKLSTKKQGWQFY